MKLKIGEPAVVVVIAPASEGQGLNIRRNWSRVWSIYRLDHFARRQRASLFGLALLCELCVLCAAAFGFRCSDFWL